MQHAEQERRAGSSEAGRGRQPHATLSGGPHSPATLACCPQRPLRRDGVMEESPASTALWGPAVYLRPKLEDEKEEEE